MKKYILRLDNKKYMGLLKVSQRVDKVIETDIHYAFPFYDEETAMEYVHAINTGEKIWNKKITSDFKVVEITELVTKVSSRKKLV